MGTQKLLCLMAVLVASHSAAIQRRTTISNKPEDQKAAAGTAVTFHCTPDTDPEILAEVTWEFKGSPIDFNSRVQMLNDYSLHISATVANDSGSYVCVVKTPVDEARAQGFLTVQDTPNPPSLDGVECRENSALVRWHSTGDPAVVSRFTIAYSTSGNPDVWEHAYEMPATESSWNVPLSPGTSYTFRVIAHNEIGASKPSERSAVCSTQPDVPYMNPLDVKAYSTRPDNMVISWSAMPPIQHHGHGFYYIVSYKRDIAGELWNLYELTDWRQSELVIPNTPPFKRYLIKVAAVNDYGFAPVKPFEVVGWSGEDTPLLAPTNFTLLEIIDKNRALVSWNPVPPESLQGHFLGYKIQVWTNDTEIREAAVRPDSNKAMITFLEPFKMNYAIVMAYNGYASGPASETVSILAPEGTPGPVHSFNAYPIANTAMMLNWEKPEAENGILTGYIVDYAKVTGFQVGPMINLRKTIAPKFNEAKLSNLEPNTKYRIWIHAETAAGEGGGFFVEQTTKFDEPSEPDAPQFEVSMMFNKTGDMLVRWLPVINGHPGTHFQVSYRLKGHSQWTQSPMELQDDYVVITDLKPHVYEVKVTAYDGDYSKDSEVEEVDLTSNASDGTTKPEQRSSVTIDFESRPEGRTDTGAV